MATPSETPTQFTLLLRFEVTDAAKFREQVEWYLQCQAWDTEESVAATATLEQAVQTLFEEHLPYTKVFDTLRLGPGQVRELSPTA